MPIQFRVATAADVPAMVRCRLSDPNAGRADERMAAYFEGKHHPQNALAPRVGYLAVENDHLVGYIAGHLTRRYACEGEVQYLFVSPTRRRTGVARALVTQLAYWFAARNAYRVCVNVEPENEAARAFYAGHGARELSKFWYVWEDIRELVRGAT